ncbi:MAG: class I SAM-dependent methyltransferase [Steroidobacteraceae bacterium]|jgi:SAM-dependent methyltransferase
MHDTALTNARHFFNCYAKHISAGRPKLLEIGSQDVNGAMRGIVPQQFDHIGADMVAGNGVDVVLEDPYVLPFAGESIDVVVSTSCFEHSEMFWLAFLEIMRVLKPEGLFYLNVPSNGAFHRYPVDCWRFYPDSGRALVRWAQRNAINTALLESYTSHQVADIWNDFVAIFVKDEKHAPQFPDRVVHTIRDYNNATTLESAEILKFSTFSEDRKKLNVISQIISNKLKVQ